MRQMKLKSLHRVCIAKQHFSSLSRLSTLLLFHAGDDKKSSDMVIEVRAGALSIDQSDLLIGLPSFEIPLLTGSFNTPEIALFKEHKRRGIAKFAAVSYDSHTGKYVYSAEPNLGVAKEYDHTLLFFISWTSDNLRPANPSNS